MIEKKFVELKKEEYAIKEFIRQEFGKGKVSHVEIEYTPLGEKIVITTAKPAIVIGRRGEKINELVDTLKKKFGLENPHIDVVEIQEKYLDAKTVADEIALLLERLGPLSFKSIAYRMLDKIKASGALGAEIRLSGKLPSERARSWRFAFGYLKKSGETAKLVDRAQSVAQTVPGTVGVKVEIMRPDVRLLEKMDINEIKKKIKNVEQDLIQKKQESAQEEKEQKTSKSQR